MDLQQGEERLIEYTVANVVWSIWSPVLLLVGLIGNTLSFVTLARQILRHRVSTIYFRALCIADSGALLFGLLPIWPLYLAGYDVTAQHAVICKLRNFLFITFSDASIWLICAFTLDRLVAVVFPLKRKSYCTRRHALIAITVIWAVATLKNVPMLITWGIRETHNYSHHVSKCGVPEPDHAFYEEYIRPWLVFTTVTFIPFIFITACNIIIVHHVQRMGLSQATIARVRSITRQSSEISVASMSRMCLAVSFTFVVLVSPSIVILVGKPYWTKTEQSEAKFHLARSFGNLCQYTNNAINFLLYLSSGREFRRELRSLCSSSNSSSKSRCSRSARSGNSNGVHYSWVDTTL
ncbi:hypothetical protein CAPTEDRAFT_198894 [Capitella teleta]|uniref:G-protein coupled receptors family 1 profile domain-containing protein n=1 Tax=Capitella teleta TaxID=283909 RepID=R7U5J6_CAPTE|nr:hypothetical protein CAPTEDRAFT_198894 [Capitella teleta]|eukprot:ELU01645.1 hypothetical protein CAPTEDRAFT_198894 [Capitella teleta]